MITIETDIKGVSRLQKFVGKVNRAYFDYLRNKLIKRGTELVTDVDGFLLASGRWCCTIKIEKKASGWNPAGLDLYESTSFPIHV